MEVLLIKHHLFSGEMLIDDLEQNLEQNQKKQSSSNISELGSFKVHEKIINKFNCRFVHELYQRFN